MAHAALLAALVLGVLAGGVANAREGPAKLRLSRGQKHQARLAAEHSVPNSTLELARRDASLERWTTELLSPPSALQIAQLAAATEAENALSSSAAGASRASAYAKKPLRGEAPRSPVHPVAGSSAGRAAGARRLLEYEYMTDTSELPRLRAVDASCKKLVVVWCAIKQAGEGASVYDTYLKVSIASALDKAPRVLPVLLFDGAADHPLAAWVRNKGGIVIIHSLSFKEKMISAVKDPLYSWQVTTWLATFSYFDIGLVADKLRALAAGAGADLANVLYTDVDTIFMADINSCSLPSPRILSAAGEVTKLSPANAGVIYLNLTAWQELHSDLMHYAELHGWLFPNADQEWLFKFFGDRVSVLPDTYNWKPYWGNPEPGAWGDPPAIKILHIHGPKFQESLCVLKYLGVNNMTTASNATLLTEIKDLCNYKRSQFSMQLLLDANKVDGGRLYGEAHHTFFQYLAQIRSGGHTDEHAQLLHGSPQRMHRPAALAGAKAPLAGR